VSDELSKALARIEEARKNRATVLDLSFLGLTKLPEFVDQLIQLQELYLYNNQLTTLPESIGQLTQLQELNLADNQLRALPESLCNLKSLKKLYLHGNRALGLPAEVLGPTWEDVMTGKSS
jgi:Leucine-rich repeat (LRR) protein